MHDVHRVRFVRRLRMTVCAVDGAPVVQARGGRWLHTEALPVDVPAHDIVVVGYDEHQARQDATTTLRQAAEDMLAHHAALHPASDCEWGARLQAAVLRT